MNENLDELRVRQRIVTRIERIIVHNHSVGDNRGIF